MNKQELIEKVIENGAWCTENHTGETDRYVKISKVRELIRLLDEPRKPVVPKFVADWFEDNKDDLEYNIWSFIYEWCHHEMDDFKYWMNYGTNRPIETLIRMKDGYEVEKEPLYYVKYKNEDSYFVEFIDSDFGRIWDEEIQRAKPFKDKTKADAVACLVDGRVVEG